MDICPNTEHFPNQKIVNLPLTRNMPYMAIKQCNLKVSTNTRWPTLSSQYIKIGPQIKLF